MRKEDLYIDIIFDPPWFSLDSPFKMTFNQFLHNNFREPRQVGRGAYGICLLILTANNLFDCRGVRRSQEWTWNILSKRFQNV